MKDPSGKKRIFSKFEDGMVYFKFTGHLPSGIWSYHAKLYHDSVFPDTKMSVDVVTKSSADSGILVEVFNSEVVVRDPAQHVKLYVKVILCKKEVSRVAITLPYRTDRRTDVGQNVSRIDAASHIRAWICSEEEIETGVGGPGDGETKE